MKNKLKKAIEELCEYYPEFKQINLNQVKNFANINEALLYLVNYVNDEEIEINNDFDTFGVMIDLSEMRSLKLII